MDMDEFCEMRYELSQIADREAIKWFRIQRKVEKKGCSNELIAFIKKEAMWIGFEASRYPEKLLSENLKSEHKYIFR
jgi:hypothetical protein